MKYDISLRGGSHYKGKNKNVLKIYCFNFAQDILDSRRLYHRVFQRKIGYKNM